MALCAENTGTVVNECRAAGIMYIIQYPCICVTFDAQILKWQNQGHMCEYAQHFMCKAFIATALQTFADDEEESS